MESESGKGRSCRSVKEGGCGKEPRMSQGGLCRISVRGKGQTGYRDYMVRAAIANIKKIKTRLANIVISQNLGFVEFFLH